MSRTFLVIKGRKVMLWDRGFPMPRIGEHMIIDTKAGDSSVYKPTRYVVSDITYEPKQNSSERFVEVQIHIHKRRQAKP